MICPTCNQEFHFTDQTDAEVFAKDNGATCDCPYCGMLILLEDNQSKDFHKTLHQEDARWPADGKNTGYLEIKEKV
jgi:DNA-directed RNA polymerase subunit RPC12/RpoP